MENVGTLDRIFRAIGGVMMLGAGLVLAVPAAARGTLVVTGVYLLTTVALGACLGYRLMGISTCRLPRHEAESRKAT
jgi:hypothetical protein